LTEANDFNETGGENCSFRVRWIVLICVKGSMEGVGETLTKGGSGDNIYGIEANKSAMEEGNG